MSEKLCVFCDHLEVEGGGYGEYAEADRMRCSKNHWRWKRHPKDDYWAEDGVALEYDPGLRQFRAAILIAEQCPDYSPPDK